MNQRARSLLVLAFLLAVVVGCSGGVQPIRRPTVEPTATPLPTFTPRPIATALAVPVAYALPTDTVVPLPTATSQPTSWAARIQGLILLYEGPGVAYGEVARLGDRTQVSVVGRNQSSTWISIAMPVAGWLKASQVKWVDPSVDLAGLPILPTPNLPTPTRRPMVVNSPTARPSNTPVSSRSFTVSPSTVQPGQCAVLTWNVTNVKALYLNGDGVNGAESQTVCPTGSTPYQLHIVNLNGSTEDLWQTVTVPVQTVPQIVMPTIVIVVNLPTTVPATQTPIVVTSTPAATLTNTPTPTATVMPSVSPTVTATLPPTPPPINLPTPTPAS